ncbi:MAG TPA: hypothetical protein VM120_29870 [Bryobacteraceae bacterium]|nr:hypothetical protein [Bryobacteraceae bacterium]
MSNSQPAVYPDILLQGEDTATYHALVDSLRKWLKPACPYEQSLVDRLASLSWRQQRIALYESRLQMFQRIITPSLLIKAWPGIDDAGRNTFSLACMRKKIKDLLNLELLLARLFREAINALAALRKLAEPPPKPRTAKSRKPTTHPAPEDG